jgi:hypothetical protein
MAEAVRLPSANQGTLTYQGIIEANGNTQAGNITLTANHIQIQDGSHITATGHLGGGQIQIGGSWQNSNPNIHQAITNTIEHNVLIDASALTNGNGGEIVVWSDITNPDSITTVNGTLYAKGGTESGDGGRIETSGRVLDVDGFKFQHYLFTVTGEWLLDPTNDLWLGDVGDGDAKSLKILLRPQLSRQRLIVQM